MSVVASSNEHLLTPFEMMKEAEQFAKKKTQKSTSMMLSLAVMAGAFIGLAFVFYITVTTGSDGSSWGLSRLIGGLAFSMGLMLIVLCGAELFTSSVLSSIAWANKQLQFGRMLRIWATVYVGNFIGAMLLLLIVTGAGLYQLDGGNWGLNALQIAQHKLHHTPIQAFSLGILCNVLVCLAIWLTFSSKNALTKAAMTVLPVAMFVSSGFEHCVANMFMVPLGITIHSFAPEAFWLQVGVEASLFADLTLSHFVTSNLIPVTLGNIVGGAVLVGLANWCIYRKPQLNSVSIQPITHTQDLQSVKESPMNATILVRDVMNVRPTTLTADMPVEHALDILLDANMHGAPVADIHGNLVGFFSVHDVMVELWCQDYLPEKGQTVVDLMSRDVIALNTEDKLVDVVEFMCIDKEQLYPTTSMGFATQWSSLSLEERAKNMQVSQPHILPVLDKGELCGVIDRQHVASALRTIYGERMSVVDVEDQQPPLRA